jgi:transcriptional regulator with XRE-family HTH domain
VNTTFAEFVANPERQRILERESLAFEATELISRLMEEQKISKAELAERLGRSRAFVTQILSGSRNLTLHTFADVVFELGCRIELEALPLLQTKDDRGYTVIYEFPDPGNRTRRNEKWERKKPTHSELKNKILKGTDGDRAA